MLLAVEKLLWEITQLDSLKTQWNIRFFNAIALSSSVVMIANHVCLY